MRRAFALVELILALLLFGLLNALIFALLQSGTRSFAITMSRGTLQSELNRSLARLQGEVRRSSATLLSVVIRNDRDGVSLSALQDWQAAAAYSSVGDPLWDEFVVFYATTTGLLVRKAYHPAGAPYREPLAGFSEATHMPDEPEGNVLAQHVEQFRLRYDGAAGILNADLRLRRRAGLNPEGRRVNDESLQASCQLRVSNP